ncbi:MAG TPA: hypothetical protein VFJ18_03285 [Pararhizobium sp.]|nr:hypothetical protein [Pararhizobium sp.]
MSGISPTSFEAVLGRTRPKAGFDDSADAPVRVRLAPWFVPQAAARPAGPAAARVEEFYAADPLEDASAAAAKAPALPSLDPQEIARELDLSGCTGIKALRLRRRRFARANHPDMVDPPLRAHATERMMIANRLIDQEIARLSRLSAAA